MITQDFTLPKYNWHVKVYYAVTTYWTSRIINELENIGCDGIELRRAYENLRRGDLNTGLTYSNLNIGETVMVISLTSSSPQFLNSWLHEMRHLSRHIERAFKINPYGEEAAYLAGEIGQRMFPVAKRFVCEYCRKRLM